MRLNASARTGIQVIDLESGDTCHWLRFEGSVEELYDVVSLSGVARPKSLGFKTDEIRRNIWFEDENRTSHWTAMDR